MSRLLGFIRFFPLFSQHLCNKSKICTDQKSTFLYFHCTICCNFPQQAATCHNLPKTDMTQPGTNWPDLVWRSFTSLALSLVFPQAFGGGGINSPPYVSVLRSRWIWYETCPKLGLPGHYINFANMCLAKCLVES